MALYHFAVTEVRTYEMRYAVEADTFDGAFEKAVIGETIAKTQIRCCGVIDRHSDWTRMANRRWRDQALRR